MVAWYVYPENEYVYATLAMAKKHKGKSSWGLGESILDASQYSVGNPRLF
jgi:hypothetical protein